MALINCPECGREKVSDSAEACPSCGYNLREHLNYSRNNWDAKLELKRYELENGIKEKVVVVGEEVKQFAEITKSKETLPEGVYYDSETGNHYRLVNRFPTQTVASEYISYKQTSYLKTIKNGIIFFVTLQCIALFVACMMWLQ